MKIDLTYPPELLQGRPFPDTEFPYPIIQSLFNTDQPRVFLERLEHLAQVSLEEQLLLNLGLAELKEAACPDRDEFFLPDRELRARLVRLNSTTGWALLWGDDDERTAGLAAALRKEDFQVYTLGNEKLASTLKQAKDLGPRPTSAVYFYQTVVRYPHVYGRVPLGAAHEVTDFIQDHGPGVMFLAKEVLSPMEEAMFLGGLALGIPAVVPTAFDLPVGNVLRADDPAAMVQSAMGLPNLRVRRRLRFQVDLPFNFDQVFSTEQIEGGRSLGGTPSSSFVVTNGDRGDGIEVVGEMGPDVGIEIALGDPRVDISMTDYLEDFAAKLPGYIEGVTAEVRGGCPSIRWREGVPLEAAHLGQAYYSGLKAHFDIGRIKVRLVFGPDLLDGMKEEAATFRKLRGQALAAATEENEPVFYACTRCHSFALEHSCTITPDRPSQCGSRSWSHVKARGALSDFDSSGLGVRLAGAALQAVVEKGDLVDPVRGEYTGVNAATELLTEGRTRRVFLHSIFEHPHTACGCFQCAGCYIPEVDGIAVIDRAFKGAGPDGRGWDEIANAAAGKQSSGYVALGKDYLRSGRFLQADGGWGRIVWMPRKLKEEFAPEHSWIATEAEVTGLKELEGWLRDRGWAPPAP